jgi:hypothetical protein
MSPTPKLTIASLLIYLRQRLLLAQEQKNQAEVQESSRIFDLLYDAAVEVRDGPLIGLTEDLSYSVNHWLMGVEWKSAIPTEEQLEQLQADPKRSPRLTIESLLIFLRKVFLLAREQKDTAMHPSLFDIFDYLEDAAGAAGDMALVRIAIDLHESVRDIGISEWKSAIPTEEELKRLLADHD